MNNTFKKSPINNTQMAKLDKIFDEVFADKEKELNKKLNEEEKKLEEHVLKTNPEAKKLQQLIDKKEKLEEEIDKMKENTGLYIGYNGITLGSFTTKELKEMKNKHAKARENAKLTKRNFRMEIWSNTENFESMLKKLDKVLSELVK